MKKKEFILLFLFAGILIFISCKKELSCESCKTNKLPIAIAGPDQVITLPTDSISLDGSASSDPDGTISVWLWKKISGPASFNLSRKNESICSIKNLLIGTYQFELMVTDNGDLSSRDTVQVIVNDPANRPPIANAGIDQLIVLPLNIAILDGHGSTDPDINITTYTWSQLSGPWINFAIPINGIQLEVQDLLAGMYQFQLKVTDAGGLFSLDTVQVQVINPPPPSCTNCRIVFVSDRDGNSEIYSCYVDGSDIRRLTNDIATDDQPAWSPDGTRIAFVSDRTGNPELYIMNADGSNVVRKTFSASYSQNPSWSPDGTKIIYSTVSNGSANIWITGAANGSSPSLLFSAPGNDDQPRWSPDGTKIALVSDWAAYDFVYDIYTINADGSGFTALTGNIFDQLDYLYPSWSPNAGWLAMTLSQTIGINQYNTQIGVMNAGGGGISVIKTGAAAWSRTSWSGDGTRIAYTSLSASGKDVSWVKSDGSASGIIVTNGWNADWQH